MKHVFVGVIPRHLTSGRPLIFGDELDESELEQTDHSVRPHLVSITEPEAHTEPETPPEPEVFDNSNPEA